MGHSNPKNDDGRAAARPSSDATAVKRDGVIWAPSKPFIHFVTSR
jgi:hypothetical protein